MMTFGQKFMTIFDQRLWRKLGKLERAYSSSRLARLKFAPSRLALPLVSSRRRRFGDRRASLLAANLLFLLAAIGLRNVLRFSPLSSRLVSRLISAHVPSRHSARDDVKIDDANIWRCDVTASLISARIPSRLSARPSSRRTNGDELNMSMTATFRMSYVFHDDGQKCLENCLTTFVMTTATFRMSRFTGESSFYRHWVPLEPLHDTMLTWNGPKW